MEMWHMMIGRRAIRPRRLLTAAAVAAAVVVSTTMLAGAAPPDDHVGIPPLPYVPFPGGTLNRYNDGGLGLDRTVQTALQPKVALEFQDLVQRAYYINCTNTFPPNYGCPGHDPQYPPIPGTKWLAIYADLWLQSKDPDAKDSFGLFPKTVVKTLAFGSVPVTATVHISQTAHAGLYDPLQLSWFASSAVIPEGTSICWDGPPDGHQCKAPPGTGYFFMFPPAVTGQLDVRISDVSVDQVPVDVGPSCHTVKPASVSLTATPGYYPRGFKPTVEGVPGDYQPFVTPGFLHGTVDIPAFSGCTNGTENFDALLTGMISAPGNPIHARQSVALTTWCKISPTDPGCKKP
jgi:hypothetical protein